MGGEPVVSVVVPAYNRAGFLPACVASIRAAGPPACQIVVVDDGSTDDTAEVLATLAGPDLVVVRQMNGGLPEARNAGLRAATGRLVAFLDSDDLWKPGVLAHLAELLDRRPDVAVAFTDAEVARPGAGSTSLVEEVGRAEFAALPHDADGEFRVYPGDAFYWLLLKRNLLFLGAAVMRTAEAREAGGFDARLDSAEDYEFNLRMALRGRFAFRPEPLAVYVQHPGNMTGNKDRMMRAFVTARRLHGALAPSAAPAVLAHRDALLKHAAFGYAYGAYDRGDYAEARARFAAAGRECGWDLKTCAYWLVSAAPLSRRLLQLARG